ncbi:DUF3945 domain-containing protein [Sphingobacterium siyangense]|uniref:Uncharacterized protein DUF3945 n=1 Tax=Sphingobacterium siyangense TaxID=459529 RepID=A0A562MLB8_9SPHI|nr:DUF3945 domain-containing protein [Sphingobacterium siyangense]TWI20361.1 uncharacterized protein DUF3945 [Sphingobacterium siyangense]
MSEENKDTKQSPDELSDILLVFDKDKKKIQAVKGIDKDGNLETVEPNKKNESQFLRVDKHGDVFSNFFSNFLRQIKNPTHFSFFKVPSPIATDVAAEMQKQVDTHDKKVENLLTKYEVKEENQQENKKDHKQENKNDMDTTQQTPENGEFRYKPEQIDWETMSQMGLSKERLEKLNLLEPLLKGYKTDVLVPISLNLGTVITRTDARLSLQPGEGDNLVVAIHGVRKEPQLNLPFFNHEFSKEDKENLLKTGNMGRVVDLTNPRTNEIMPSIISVDRLTNELIALRTDRIKIPEEIKGIKLDDTQKQTLLEGKPLYIEGMISKKGEPFNATVQFNADKRYVEFMFDRSNTQQQKQDKTQQQQSEVNDLAPRVFRGKELDDKQYEKFKEGQTVYVDGLTDKKGQKYQGYITFDKETGKTGFSFDNPNKLKEKVQPKEENKTQVAVNSEGKTNESTKNIKEPLKTAQKDPDSKEQKEQQKQNPPAKSKGRKM